MASGRSSHRLVNVNLEQRNAVCSTCGPTKIVVRKDSKFPHRKPELCCVNRYREVVRNSQRRRREKARLQDPNWKPKHKLSEINVEKMRANCAVCGPTDILVAAVNQDRTYYRCAKIIRKRARDYARLHYKAAGKP